MKLLLIHADDFSYEAREKTPVAEEISEEMRAGSFDEVLVAFISVEKRDSRDVETAARMAADEILSVADRVGAERVVVYPYAHLSPDLADPKTAVEVLVGVEKNLVDSGVEVHRSPFGWYKAFSIKCKGHPLSELSREIDVSKGETGGERITREDIVEKIKSRFLVLTPGGEEIELVEGEPLPDHPVFEEFPALKKFVENDMGLLKEKKEPPSIKAMQRLELVDYEEASDAGHFRFYPKGALMFHLLKDWADHVSRDVMGAVQIETPILYDWSQPDIQSQGKSFHERHYMVYPPEGKKEFVLRFAGDFGLFRLMKDATISYRHLPIRVYEFSKSFRYEKRGELTGLKRLRAFHMPDVHSFSRDLEQGWEEYRDIYRALDDLAKGTGIEYAIAFRVVEEFYQRYRDNLVELLRHSGAPALIEVLSERKHYWVVKHEFQAVDAVGGTCQLCTVQLDVEDAARYGITYVDENGEEKGCIICHTSVGSIERWIYSILEDALKKEKPEFPFWLSPTQVRIIPVGEGFVDDCVSLARSLPGRVDVDDRDATLGKKIREAEREWVNIIVVYGEKERETGKLSVRLRSGEKKTMTVEELADRIKELQGDYPFRPLPLPMLLSKRPQFR